MTPSQALIYYATRCVCVTERATFDASAVGGVRTTSPSHHDPECKPCMYAIADPEIRALLDGTDEGCTIRAREVDVYVMANGRHTMDLAEQTCIATSTIGRRVRNGFYSERQLNDAAVETIGPAEPDDEDDEETENDGMSGACLCHDAAVCPDVHFGEGPDY